MKVDFLILCHVQVVSIREERISRDGIITIGHIRNCFDKLILI